jgi:tripartite-type tricarboxylate transporter receptor subunit TctC
MIESGFPGFEMGGFLGLLAPVKTPRGVVQTLNSEMAALSKQRDFIDRLDTFGMQPVGSTPEQFEQFMQAQIAKWARVFKSAGSKPQQQ